MKKGQPRFAPSDVLQKTEGSQVQVTQPRRDCLAKRHAQAHPQQFETLARHCGRPRRTQHFQNPRSSHSNNLILDSGSSTQGAPEGRPASRTTKKTLEESVPRSGRSHNRSTCCCFRVFAHNRFGWRPGFFSRMSHSKRGVVFAVSSLLSYLIVRCNDHTPQNGSLSARHEQCNERTRARTHTSTHTSVSAQSSVVFLSCASRDSGASVVVRGAQSLYLCCTTAFVLRHGCAPGVRRGYAVGRNDDRFGRRPCPYAGMLLRAWCADSAEWDSVLKGIIRCCVCYVPFILVIFMATHPWVRTHMRQSSRNSQIHSKMKALAPLR